MKTSLIISTYNWHLALNLILKSVENQREVPDEVIIADDGSTEKTKLLIEKYQHNFPVPLHHVWHPDKGFRASEIRNKAIKKSQYEYIIQIDGDTVLHPNFVKDHKKLAQKNCFISGSRVLVNQQTTQKHLKNESINFSAFAKGTKNFLNAVYFPFANHFITPKKNPIEKLIYKIRGCNMSFWREDLINVGGYDESFVGWGREDSELVLRLLKKGVHLKRIKMAAIQYHLYHKENDRSNLEKNHAIMMQSLNNEGYKAKESVLYT